MKTQQQAKADYLKKVYRDHKWLVYPLIGVGFLAGLWALGKSARIIGGALRDFRELKNAIKGN